MSEFRIDQVTNRSGEAGTNVSGITTFSGTSGMILPNGPSTYRGGRGRGVFFGGSNPRKNTIDYVEIATTGNAMDFGDASRLVTYATGCSSSVRAVMIGGEETSGTPGWNEMYIINFASKGGTSNFGKLDTDTCYGAMVTGNNTRAIINSGYGGIKDSFVSYIEIATTGNGTFWGDPGQSGSRWYGGDCASPTRGVLMGGIQSEDGIFDESQGNVAASSDDGVKYMRYVTFSTLGSSQHFGELSWISRYGSGTGSSTRGICVQGSVTGTSACTNNIDYITIASTGNGADFGDLTVERNITTSTGSQTRAVIAGGQLQPSPHTMSDTIDYIQIATTGNATDFGNLTDARWGPASASDVHGGIG